MDETRKADATSNKEFCQTFQRCTLDEVRIVPQI